MREKPPPLLAPQAQNLQLSQKVTKAMRRIRRSLPAREKGKYIETDNQRYDRERLCQP